MCPFGFLFVHPVNIIVYISHIRHPKYELLPTVLGHPSTVIFDRMPKATCEQDEEIESETDVDVEELLGTRISDEELPRNRRDSMLRAKDPERHAKFGEAVVSDGKGRPCLQRSLMVGVSAGHHITVGSEEGWTTREWRSSRRKRSEQIQQRAESYMDQDDFAAAGKNWSLSLQTCSGFAGSRYAGNNIGSAAQAGIVAHEEIGSKLCALLNTEVAETVGWRLLRQMGWRNGYGRGLRHPRSHGRAQCNLRYHARGSESEGCLTVTAPVAKQSGDTSTCGDSANDGGVGTQFDARVIYAPRAIAVVNFASKSDLHGVGYNALRGAPEFSTAAATVSPSAVVNDARAHAMRQPQPVGSFPTSYDDHYESRDALSANQFDTSLAVDEIEVGGGGGGQGCDKVLGAGIPLRVPALLVPRAPRLTQRAISLAPCTRIPMFVPATRTVPRQAWYDPPVVPMAFKEWHVFPLSEPPHPLLDTMVRELCRSRSLTIREGTCDKYDPILLMESTTKPMPAQASQMLPLEQGSAAAALKGFLGAPPTMWALVGEKEMVLLWQQLQDQMSCKAVNADQTAQSTYTESENSSLTSPSTYTAPVGRVAAKTLLSKTIPPQRPQPQSSLLPLPSASQGWISSQQLLKPNVPPVRSSLPQSECVLPEGCTQYRNDCPKQGCFGASLRDAEVSKPVSLSSGLNAANLAPEAINFGWVARFSHPNVHSAMSERFVVGEQTGVCSSNPARVSHPLKRPSSLACAATLACTAPRGDVELPKNTPSMRREPTPAKTLDDGPEAARLAMFGSLTHSVHRWLPKHLLCKRFNVPPPPSNAVRGDRVSCRAQNHFQSTSIYDDTLLLDVLQVGHPERHSQECVTQGDILVSKRAPIKKSERRSVPLPSPTLNCDKAAAVQASAKPPSELFKAVFEESDEDEAKVPAFSFAVASAPTAASFSATVAVGSAKSAAPVPVDTCEGSNTFGDTIASQSLSLALTCSQFGSAGTVQKFLAASAAAKTANFAKQAIGNSIQVVRCLDNRDSSSEVSNDGWEKKRSEVVLLRAENRRLDRQVKKPKKHKRERDRREKKRKHKAEEPDKIKKLKTKGSGRQ